MRSGIAHRPMKYETLHVFDRLVLCLDLEVETARRDLFMPFIQAHGRTFTHQNHQVLTVPHFREARCFDAAFQIASRYNLIYCEGIAVFHGINGTYPLGHGWCSTKDGHIIDPTMPHIQGDERVQYYGVPILKDYALDWAMRVGYMGCLDGYSSGEIGPIYSDNPRLWKDELDV